MISWKRAAAAVAIASAPIGSAGVTLALTAAPAGALPSCTDTWQGPLTGTTNWNASSSNWSSGFPTSTSVVCINAAGTYSVDLTSGVTINTLELGGGATGTQTLIDDGSSTNVNLAFGTGATSTVSSNGVLKLATSSSGFAEVSGGTDLEIASGGTLSTAGASSIAYLRAPITNDSGGTVTIGAATTNQDEGTLTTNSGSFTVSSSGGYTITNGGFTSSAGSLTVTGSMLENGGTFTQSGGTESGNAVELENATLADSAGGTAFDVISSSTLSGTIPSGQTVTVDGSHTNVDLAVNTAVTDEGTLALSTSSSGFAELGGTGSLEVASGGTLSTTGASSIAYLRAPITNDSGGTVTIGAATTNQDEGTLTTNSGSFTVSSSGGYTITNGGFTSSAGSLTVTGSMLENGGTFTQSGGTESGNAVELENATLADSAGGTAFDVIGSGTLTGTIPAGQTVTVDGSHTNVDLALNTAVTDKGTLALDPTSSGLAMVYGTGSLTIHSGGTFSTTGTSSTAYMRLPITNQSGGTVTIGAATTNQDEGTLTTNSGSFTVSLGGGYTITNGGFTNSAGSLTVTGSMLENGGTFTQSGGTESGNAVQLEGTTLADSAGTGAFDVIGSGTLSGTIPAGQTVTVDGSHTNVQLGDTAAVTIDGILALNPTSSGFAMVTGSSTFTVANGGTLSTSGPSSTAYFRAPIAISAGGTMTVGALSTHEDDGTGISNSGTLQVLNGGELTLSGGSTLASTSSATVGVTVNGTAGTGGIAGPGVTDAGTLDVTTIGSPAISTVFTPISGPSATGTFSAFSFGPNAYTVAYPSGTVQLTTDQPFTLTPTPFSPESYHQTGSIQVASINNANLGTGTYSATVNWGDGKPTQSATVNVTGTSGTIVAPTHKYKTAGPFTVTVTLANTDGTIETTTDPITVTGPIFTSFSPASGPVGTKVTINGSDLAGATVKFFGGHTGTILSDTATQIKVKVPSGAGGTGKITVIVADGKSKTPTTFTVT